MKDKLLEILELIREDVVNICVDPHTDYLDNIRMSFEKVNIKYEYVKPNVDKEKKVTTIKSKTNVEQSKL